MTEVKLTTELMVSLAEISDPVLAILIGEVEHEDGCARYVEGLANTTAEDCNCQVHAIASLLAFIPALAAEVLKLRGPLERIPNTTGVDEADHPFHAEYVESKRRD